MCSRCVNFFDRRSKARSPGECKKIGRMKSARRQRLGLGFSFAWSILFRGVPYDVICEPTSQIQIPRSFSRHFFGISLEERVHHVTLLNRGTCL
jgi:hypothetical protein